MSAASTDSSSKLRTKSVPSYLLTPLEPFADSWRMKALEGQARMAFANVAMVGLARNCAGPLRQNLQRAHAIGTGCRSWRLHIETNDNTDDTVAVLEDFCSRHPQASYRDQTLNRQQFSAEFAGPRTIALAEYRAACQQWVRDHASDAEYIIVVDFDAWGGWSLDGVRNGFGWLVELPGAYGMATVSLMEHPAAVTDGSGVTRVVPSWMHYDCWCARGIGQPNCYWDDYTSGFGGWKHQFLPAVGSPPVLVSSAFGGMAIYRAEDYLLAEYDGANDCEHISAHRSIAEKTGKHLYLNPSMRTIMRWMDACDPSGVGVQ